MDLGIPTLIEHKCIEETAKLAKEIGFQFVELNMNLPWVYNGLNAEELKRLSALYSVYFTIHADENMFFCDFNDKVANAHLDTMLELIRLAKENAIPLINFHMSQGVYFRLPGSKIYLFEEYEAVYRQKLIRFGKLCSEAAGNQVMLCVENTGLNHPFIHRAVDQLLSFPSFWLTWDVGHDFCASLCDTPFLQERKSKIIHMHLHDAKGKDCHLPLGQGVMELNDCIKKTQPQRMVIEVKTAQGIRQSLPWLQVNNYL